MSDQVDAAHAARVLFVNGLLEPLAAASGVAIAEVYGRGRTALVVRVRHAIWFRLWRLGFSLSEIGRIFSRDHSTVLVAVRNYAAPAHGEASSAQR